MATMTMDFGTPRVGATRTSARAIPVRSGHARLTARGQLVVRVVAVLAIALAAFLLLSFGRTAVVSALTGSPAPVSASHTVVVKPGDTLWSIAARDVPGDTVDAIGRIRTLNGMAPTDTLAAGQTLLIPSA